MFKRLVTLSPRRTLSCCSSIDLFQVNHKVQIHSSQDQRPDLDMEHLNNNPYLKKYAEKLKHLQESSPEEFQKKLDELAGSKKTVKTDCCKDDQPVQVKPQSLDSIMKLDLVQHKSESEIAELWKAYHSNKDCVFAIIPTLEYQEIYQKSKDFPVFLYPVPRGEGYEFFVQFWNGHVCHFAPLISYQTHGENAVPCLSLTHYTELMNDKGVVLMTGEPSTNILSVYESQLLALQVKMYYGFQSGLKFNYVRMFNNTPLSFRHSDLIREFENYKKDMKEKLLNQNSNENVKDS